MKNTRKRGQHRPTLSLKHSRIAPKISVNERPMIHQYSDPHLVEDDLDFDFHELSNAEVQLINRNYSENKYRQILNTIALHGVQVVV